MFGWTEPCLLLGTGLPAFREVALLHLAFMKDLTLEPVLSNQKKSEEIFVITHTKKTKLKRAFSVGFAAGAIIESMCTWAEKVVPPSSFPKNYIQHPSIQPPSL